ncbi:MAG: peptidylprolyl isomerase [Desulfobacterales bacterium]|nr:peptidylprolyl isomerase [Desulfobacterales bacterium]
MSKAKKGDNVKVHYTGTLADGTCFDSSLERAPLAFTIGKGMLLPAFESGVIGLRTGESINIHIPAKDGYGLRDEQLIGSIPLDRLPQDLNPQVGMKLQMKTPEGEIMIMAITELRKSSITVDGNHHLAGQDLNFEIKLVEILPH